MGDVGHNLLLFAIGVAIIGAGHKVERAIRHHTEIVLCISAAERGIDCRTPKGGARG